MLDELVKLGKNASSMLGTCKYVRVFSHNDTDGLAAAGVMCNALHRLGIIFHCSIIPQLDHPVAERVNKEQSDAVVFCDMGSGQPGVISKIRDRVLVIDHHIPYGKLECLHVNPHLVGINGANEISASGTAYLVAREMGDNRDLAGLALTGAIGDKQDMAGANGSILEDAVKSGAVTVGKGLRLGDGNIEELLEYTLDPYIDVSGDRDGIKAFLSDINVRGDVNGLDGDARRRLASALVLRLAKRAAPEALNLVVGDMYRLNRDVIPNIFDFSNVLNTCGKLEKPGLGIALCMRDRAPLDEALRLMRDEQRSLVKLIRDAESKVRTCANMRYLMLNDTEGTGVIAGTLVRYVFPDLPFVVMNEVEGVVKVSARGTRKLVSRGLDMAVAMREASALVGGTGGGHNIASGASIPPGKKDEFINAVDGIIGKQLGVAAAKSQA